ncbi:hypothetical protein SAMN02800694_2774 [Luteibacter sp. UNCMF331Sha3.1]|nr:hypothetical protein SAMN02800694_2774 [Luteibacter sp. UNCMF331Sha3.1]
MSDRSATASEITRDLLVAYIGRTSGYLGGGDAKKTAQDIADAFEIIYAKVAEKWRKE